MKSHSIETLVHKDDVNMVMGYHRQRMQGEKVPTIYEFKGARKDGSIVYIEVHVVELKDDKKIVGTRSYLWNVTERKRVETDLRTQLLDDELTGLHNRRGFSILTQQQLKIAERKLGGLIHHMMCIIKAPVLELYALLTHHFIVEFRSGQWC